MSKAFFDNEKGIVYKVINGNATKLSITASFLPSSKGESKDSCITSALLIQNVSMKRDNVVIPVVGVDKKRLLYTFGEDFGQLVIRGIILTGGSKYDGKQPKELVQNWEKMSLAASNEPCSIKWAGMDMKVAIKDITIETANTELGILSVTMIAFIIPVTNKHS